MIEVRKTKVFNSWLSNLKDERALAKITARIDRVALGNFGDAKFFGGIGELRMITARAIARISCSVAPW